VDVVASVFVLEYNLTDDDDDDDDENDGVCLTVTKPNVVVDCAVNRRKRTDIVVCKKEIMTMILIRILVELFFSSSIIIYNFTGFVLLLPAFLFIVLSLFPFVWLCYDVVDDSFLVSSDCETTTEGENYTKR
jgi:hypothetical protein